MGDDSQGTRAATLLRSRVSLWREGSRRPEDDLPPPATHRKSQRAPVVQALEIWGALPFSTAVRPELSRQTRELGQRPGSGTLGGARVVGSVSAAVGSNASVLHDPAGGTAAATPARVGGRNHPDRGESRGGTTCETAARGVDTSIPPPERKTTNRPPHGPAGKVVPPDRPAGPAAPSMASPGARSSIQRGPTLHTGRWSSPCSTPDGGSLAVHRSGTSRLLEAPGASFVVPSGLRMRCRGLSGRVGCGS